MQGLRLVQLIKPPPMYNLSELIKTDCCIDCGTNEKLREVVGKIGIPEDSVQKSLGIRKTETYIEIINGKYLTVLFSNMIPIPLTSINIDL